MGLYAGTKAAQATAAGRTGRAGRQTSGRSGGPAARHPVRRARRRRLQTLLETATQHVHAQLRAAFRGQIDSVLDRVRLVPHNLPERMARQKMVDELVDRIIKRGFLAMGDLRDALSRNNLKLPDVDTVGFDQWLSGDQLLEIDRLLADELDGVYRSGELYMRLPQRLSSLAFGTPLGRFFTRYVAIPFGGAYLALEGIYHLVHLLLWVFGLAAVKAIRRRSRDVLDRSGGG